MEKSYWQQVKVATSCDVLQAEQLKLAVFDQMASWHKEHDSVKVCAFLSIACVMILQQHWELWFAASACGTAQIMTARK